MLQVDSLPAEPQGKQVASRMNRKMNEMANLEGSSTELGEPGSET